MAAGFGRDRARESRAWDHLVQDLQPDVALLQEVHEEDAQRWHGVDGISIVFCRFRPDLVWGSAVLTRGLPVAPVDVSNHIWLSRLWGSVIVADVGTGDDVLRVASVHAQARAIPKSDLVGVDTTDLSVPGFKDVWPLYVIFHDLNDLLCPLEPPIPFLVGGDLNAARDLDKPGRVTGNNAFFDLARDRGFRSLTEDRWGEERQTFHRSDSAPYQLDHLLSDASTAGLLGTPIIDDAAVTELRHSDHTPLSTTYGRRDVV
jgi:endonuclease/exonuclease/phosphatase family metal-dependent hydrolase